MEAWPSGWRRTTRNRVGVYASRRFESSRFRQNNRGQTAFVNKNNTRFRVLFSFLLQNLLHFRRKSPILWGSFHNLLELSLFFRASVQKKQVYLLFLSRSYEVRFRQEIWARIGSFCCWVRFRMLIDGILIWTCNMGTSWVRVSKGGDRYIIHQCWTDRLCC